MLSPKEQTELADQVIDRIFAEENAIVEELARDGGFIGDIMLPGPDRLDRYWAMTPNLSDVPLLIDPDWEMRIRNNLDRPPINPYWMNLLREPGLLKSTSQDFVRLNQQYGDRYEEAGDEVVPSPGQVAVPAGGGVRLPMEEAGSTPQPQAGGGGGGYGAPV